METAIMIETDECLQCLNCYTKVNHCEKSQYQKQINSDVIGIRIIR